MDPTPPTRPLADDLFGDGHEFDFFQVVRVLEAVYADRLPDTLDPVDRLAEAVRVRGHASLVFPAGSVYRVDRPRGDDPRATVVATFFGLIGPNGTLPLEYTELVCRLATEGGVRPDERTALRDWFDLFNNRLALMLYAGWEKYRLPMWYARYARLRAAAAATRLGVAPDPVTGAVFSLVGLGAPSTRGRLRVDAPAAPGEDRPAPLAAIDDLALLHYAGLLARRPPTAAGLEILIADYFGVGARVEEVTGQWLIIDEAALTRLAPGGGGRLGENTIAGRRVWDPSSKFRVVLGPLRYAQFVGFLPDRTPVPARKEFFLLCHLIRLYVGAEFDFDVQLGLVGEEVPRCVIAGVPHGELGFRLGWNTWLPHAAPPAVVSDVCLTAAP